MSKQLDLMASSAHTPTWPDPHLALQRPAPHEFSSFSGWDGKVELFRRPLPYYPQTIWEVSLSLLSLGILTLLFHWSC